MAVAAALAGIVSHWSPSVTPPQSEVSLSRPIDLVSRDYDRYDHSPATVAPRAGAVDVARSKRVEPAPAPPVRGRGPTSAQWAALRNCESGGDYANRRNPAYRGGYQAAWATWGDYAGYHDPADAPPAVQDEWARELYALRGAEPWPVCGRYL